MVAKSTHYKYYQPNKKDLKDEYGDCVIRALCKVTGKEWLEVYSKYLEDQGFKWVGIKAQKGKSRPTVATMYKVFPKGTCIIRVAHHVVAMVDGFYYDTWDSGGKSVYGYYVKE